MLVLGRRGSSCTAKLGTDKGEMQEGGGGDGTDGIVNGEIDVVRLAGGGDFLGFRESAADAEIDAGEVDQLFFDNLTELPLGVVLFARRPAGRSCAPRRLRYDCEFSTRSGSSTK